MKINFTILLLIITGFLYSQDTTYLDSTYETVKQNQIAKYFQVEEYDSSDSSTYTIKRYLISSGQMVYWQSYLKENKKSKFHGDYKEWYENGQIRYDIKYNLGKIEGQLLTYWKNGQARRSDNYKNDIFIDGVCWDSLGNVVPHTTYETKPEFIGGMDALAKFLGKNINYPQKAIRKGIEGLVYVKFVIEKNGEVSSVQIAKGAHKLLNKAALEVVKKMPKWSPGTREGAFVRVSFTLPINFKL